MVRKEDYILNQPDTPRDEWLDMYAEARQGNAEVQDRDDGGAIFSCREESVYGNKAGLVGEWLCMVYLSPLKWYYFKTGDIYRMPDLALYAPDEPHLRADFPRTGMTRWGYPPFLDAKTNRTQFFKNYLLVPATDDPFWIYIHCYLDEPLPPTEGLNKWTTARPKVVAVGWCWGFEAQSKNLGVKASLGVNNHQIPHDDVILRPMATLRVFLDLCRQHGMELALVKWKERGHDYDPDRYPRQRRQ